VRSVTGCSSARFSMGSIFAYASVGIGGTPLAVGASAQVALVVAVANGLR